MATRFAAAAVGNPALIGLLTHLATSAVYGALFGVLWYLARPGRFTTHRRLAGLLSGLVYGGFLLLAARVLTGAGGDGLFGFGAGHVAVAHLLYGGLLGWVSQRGR